MSLTVIEYNFSPSREASSSVMIIKGLPMKLFYDYYQGQTILYLKVRSLLLYSFLNHN